MKTNPHIPAVLIFIMLLLSILFLFGTLSILSIGSLISLIQGTADAGSQMIMAFALGLVCLLLILCAWFVLEKIRNKDSADTAFNFPFSRWHIFLGMGIVISCIGIGVATTFVDNILLSWLVLPTLTILVIASPIWLIFWLGSHGLELGARWRFFSIFGISITIAPLIMITLELVILFLGIFFGAIYIGITQPEMVREIQVIAEQIQLAANNEEALLNLLAPYLANTTLISIGIIYIAVIVPLIEELFKPLGVWFFAKQIDTPAQGFALGLLSGAAFALFESLNASADSSTSWGVIVSVRAGTSLLHITVSGIMGWGIVSAFKEKKYGRLFGAYLSAVLIHGVWNAAAAGAGISAIGESIGKPEWLFNFAPALMCGLLVLAIGMVAVLVASNRKLREHEQKSKITT